MRNTIRIIQGIGAKHRFDLLIFLYNLFVTRDIKYLSRMLESYNSNKSDISKINRDLLSHKIGSVNAIEYMLTLRGR